jgi:hypothetical protein
VFINLETDPRILHSSPHRACVNLPPPIALGLLLTSALGCYSDSTRTPTHVLTQTLLGHPLSSALRCYSDSCSLPHSDSTRNPTLVVISIRLSEYSSTSLQSCIHVYRPHAELRVYPHYEFWELHSDVPLRHPLGHPCLNSSYKSEPTPSDPVRTPILVRVTIRTLVIQLRSDICVSLRLTSSSLCLQGPLRPPSLSTLRVLRGSEPLVTGGWITLLERGSE